MAEGNTQGGAQPTPKQAPATPAENIRQWLKGKPIIPLMVASALVIAIVVALLLWAQSPNYRVLYSNLSDSDGGTIIAALEQQNVPYKLAQGGHAVLVPSDKVYKLRLSLAQKGLPKAGNVGLDIMDNQPFGVSQFTEHINYQRGLQGELARSIETLNPVAEARVHLALPKDSLFVRKQKPGKATVVLTLQPGRSLGRGQVDAIVHMVASSVTDLAPENVSVINQKGDLLTKDAGRMLDGTRLDYIHKIETRYQRRIEKILTPIVGPSNVHVQVTAAMDFRQREETNEHYAPNQGTHPPAVRSKQTSISGNDKNNLAGGIPGALTNTPPGSAPSPIEDPDEPTNPDQDQNQAANNAPVAGNNSNQATTDTEKGENFSSESTINYELDHDITHIKHPLGTIKHLSVAVVVNYHPEEQEDGSSKMVPLDDTVMTQLNDLTREAMGYSKQRGDTLKIVNTQFAPSNMPVEDHSFFSHTDWIALATTIGRYLVVIVIALLLYFLLLKPLRKRYLDGTAARGKTPPPLDLPDNEEETPEPIKPRRRYRPPNYEQSLNEFKQRAEDDPALIAMIVKSWMKKDGK